MTDAARLVTDLFFVIVDHVRNINRDYRREFCAAVALEQINSILLFIGSGNLLAQFLRAGNNIAQTGKFLGAAAS